MKKSCLFLFFLIINLPCIASKTVMQPLKQTVDSTGTDSFLHLDLNTVALMTAQDLSKNDSSNLNLTNKTGGALTVYGVYLYGVASITPGLDCINGIAGGSNSSIQPYMTGLVSPIEFHAGQSVAIGQNYLYNMLYTWIYFYTAISGTPGCLLPGCTWTGDTPHNWCIQLGAMSPDAPYTYTSYNTNVVPFSWSLNGPGYSYDLIPNPNNAYIWLGPFTCNDQTLTCTTPVPKFQSFPS